MQALTRRVGKHIKYVNFFGIMFGGIKGIGFISNTLSLFFYLIVIIFVVTQKKLRATFLPILQKNSLLLKYLVFGL